MTSDRPTRLKWIESPALQLLAGVIMLACLLLLTALNWRGLHVGLLVWGLLVALAWTLYPMMTERLALRLVPDAAEEARLRLRRRQRASQFYMAPLALGAAILGAGTGWIAVDILFTALLLVVGGLSALAGAVIVRRHQAQKQQPDAL